MALISLSSNHSKSFSYELNKNPKSGLQAQPLREGTLFGFYSLKAQKYNLYFQDHLFQSSYQPLENHELIEYNDLSRYVDPYLYLTMLDKGIKVDKNIESNNGDNTTKLYRIELHNVLIKNLHLLEVFKKDIVKSKSIHIEYNLLPNTTNIFNISFIYRTTSLNLLLQPVKLFLILCGANLEQAQVFKYLKELVDLGLGYQLRNIFKIKHLTPSLFKEHKDLLNKQVDLAEASTYFNLQYGNAEEQRKEFILKAFNNVNSLHFIDVGCGDNKYFKTLYKVLAKKAKEKNKPFSYIAIDKDEEILKEVQFKAQRENLTSLYTFTSLEEFYNSSTFVKDIQYNIIMAEIIEHMIVDDSSKIINSLKSNLNIEQIVITTPNKLFNTFYNLNDGELRNEDHLLEFDKIFLSEYLINNFPKEASLYYKINNVGDEVNGHPTTLGVIINDKKGFI